MNVKGSTRCHSEGCTSRGTAYVVDLDHPGMPELFCRVHAEVLVGVGVVRAGSAPRVAMLRVWDEVRAHHHALTSFTVAGIALLAGARGAAAWVLLGLLAVSAAVDIISTHRRSRVAWPLCIAPLGIGLTTLALLLEPVSYVGLATIAAYAFLMLLELIRDLAS